MISFLKTYKHVALGLVFTILIIYVSDRLKLVFIDKNEILANSMIFIFMWSLFTLIIYKAPELIANKTTTLKLLALLVLLIITFVIDHNMRIPDNPIVIILMVVLGILTLLLLAPKILHRYKFPITVFYVLTLGYFLYRRVIMNDMSTYYQQQKEVLILLMLPFFIVLFLWAYHQMRRFNDFKIEKGKAELALLKSQINPHQLYSNAKLKKYGYKNNINFETAVDEFVKSQIKS